MPVVIIKSLVLKPVVVLLSFVLLCGCMGQVQAQQKSGASSLLQIPFGKNNSIVYNLGTGTYTVVFNGKESIRDAYAICKGTQVSDSRLSVKRTYVTTAFHNQLGQGKLYTISLSGNNPLQQLFYVFPGKNYFVTGLKLSGAHAACHYMAPLVTEQVLLPAKKNNRSLFVPFDNDMWIRYQVTETKETRFTSSEVTALYNNDDRTGIVAGSLEHKVWKSGVQVIGKDNETLTGFSVFAGYTDSTITHDKLEHGTVLPVKGICSSPNMLIGYFEDWRDGMEEYAKLNVLAEPAYLSPWTAAAPVGWNSWGALQTGLNLERAKAVVDFFHDSCKLFRTADHTLYIDLDSYWDNMARGGIGGDLGDLKAFVAYCRQKGFQPGIYWGPFADWGKYDRKIEGSVYNYAACWTRSKGQVMAIDGAWTMDPTHPGTRERIAYYIKRFKECGFRMIKIDFLGHGAMEADHFYDSTVTTGMQAYRKGMEFLADQIGKSMLVYAAISPNMATARYVHMRRIACDAFSAIDNTEYTLNSTGYGWWQSKLYQYLDADHVVLNNAPVNVNRARVASSVVTGTFITGDDYSKQGPWRSTAQTLLQNRELLLLAQQGKSFRPVETNTGNGAVEVFTQTINGVTYLALFNYSNAAKSYTIPLNRIKKGAGNAAAIELFTGKSIHINNNITVPLGAADAAIYRLSGQ
jgi:alpha-galactosidase